MPSKPILIVEDDETIRDNLKEYLEFEGYSVQTANNGKAGLAIIRAMGGRCLVLLDLQMPIMTGEQLLDALLKDINPEISSTSIIILTARAEPVKYSVCAFLRKPLDLDMLLETVRKFS